MADDTKTEKAKRERKFPIRHFSNLLDQFLETETVDGGGIEDLRDAINAALLEHYKS